MNSNAIFALLYLGCSLIGDAGYKASRCLTISRNLYYLLKPDVPKDYKIKSYNK